MSSLNRRDFLSASAALGAAALAGLQPKPAVAGANEVISVGVIGEQAGDSDAHVREAPSGVQPWRDDETEIRRGQLIEAAARGLDERADPRNAAPRADRRAHPRTSRTAAPCVGACRRQQDRQAEPGSCATAEAAPVGGRERRQNCQAP